MTNLLDIHVGSVLVADGGFTCLDEGQKVVVEMDSDAFQPFGRQMHGLFVRCEKGRHYLAGQLDDQLNLIGLTLASDPDPIPESR